MTSPGRSVGLAVAYTALAVLFLTPLSLHPTDTVRYVGDGLGSVYFVSEMARRLFENPTRLFEAGLAYPHAHASLFEAHRLLIALIAAPFLWLSGNPVLATNIVTLIAYAFNGWAAHHLARRLGLRDSLAFVVGGLFAFNTYALNESSRVNVVFLGFLPLAIASLVAYMETGERKQAWKVALFMLSQAYAENYYLVYGSLVLALILIPYVVFRGKTAVLRLGGLALPALLAAVLFLPILTAYLQMDREFDYRREAPQTMDLDHYFAPLPGNVLYGSLGREVRAQQMAAHFVGFGSLIMAVVAIVGLAVRRPVPGDEDARIRPRAWIAACAASALIFVLLSVGRDVQWKGTQLMPGPFGFLFDHVGLFQRLRIPERLSLIAMLFIALLAARGIALMPWRTLRAILCIFLPLEHLSVSRTHVRLPVGSDIPAVYSFLKADTARAVGETPIHGEGLVRMESLDMYYSLFHQKRIAAAYLSFAPLLSSVLRRHLAAFPGEETLDALRRVGLDTIVLHTGRDGGADMNSAAQSEPARSHLRQIATFQNDAHVVTESGRDLGDAGLDVVYRIEGRPLEPSARQPEGRRVSDAGWIYKSSAGAAETLGDGDPDTVWKSVDPIHGGEYVQVAFRGAAVALGGVRLPLSRLQVLPSSFVIEGRQEDGSWQLLATYDAAHRRQLIDSLLASPGRVRLGFALDAPKVVYAVRLRALEGAESFEGWCLSELELLAPLDSSTPR